MDHRLLPLLPRVSKPGRYTNKELNAVHKDWRGVELKVALAFPDIYDVGMSHLGYKILYALINAREDALAERVYAPWIDLQKLMSRAGLPLTSLESGRELAEFDFLGFTLQYELSYTNILRMLDLGRIPRLSAQRGDHHPFVMAGGPCAFNVEPLADFLDFVVLGEGEEVVQEILDLASLLKRRGLTKKESLALFAQLKGVYVPSYYQPQYYADGTFRGLKLLQEGAPSQIAKRVVTDLNKAPFPQEFVVPFVEVIHDRAVVEILRGCTRGCRFCQAGMIYRPARERDAQLLKKQVAQLVQSSGYDEISLASLSSGDYSGIESLVRELIAQYQNCGATVSLPSLRLDSFSVQLAQEIQKSRKTGLTFAPEAGTERLRRVINKNVSEDDLYQVVKGAFAAGWRSLKLYFMIGLPSETEEDLAGIVKLAHQVLELGREYAKGGRLPEVTVSAASFVPKAHTPFQWEGQNSPAALSAKQDYLRERLRLPGVRFNYPRVEESFLEAVFARGDRRLGRVLNRAVDLGCQFDSWSDCFRYDLWERAFPKPAWTLFGTRSAAGIRGKLPWEHLSAGVSKEFLLKERERAFQGKLTPDCRWAPCSGCGVCSRFQVANLLAEEKKGG